MRAPIILGVAFALVVAACGDDAGTPTTSTTTTTTVTTTTSTQAPATTAPGTTSSTSAPTTTTTSIPVPLDEFEIGVELVAEGFEQPVLVTSRPGDDRLFVVEQGGRILAVDPASGERTVFLDIQDRVRWQGEQGLIGLAFFPTDGDRFVVHHTDNDGDTMVAEYGVDEATGLGDRGSARTIFTARQPARNHNGGMIAFGPDGFLYVALGDGGGAGDRYDNGQDPFTPLGAILRLDLSGDPYAIPADNPFADGVDGAPEVWAWGLRNPWRFAFDGTDLWVGDVGQGAWEEIDLFDASRPGDNAGWPLVEGTHCYRTAGCDPTAFLGPITEYAHEAGRCSVTGGAVYRGSAIPDLVGTYLYGDYCTGEIWGLRRDATVEERRFTGATLDALSGLTSFGVGPDGELYVMQASGRVWRIVGA